MDGIPAMDAEPGEVAALKIADHELGQRGREVVVELVG